LGKGSWRRSFSPSLYHILSYDSSCLSVHSLLRDLDVIPLAGNASIIIRVTAASTDVHPDEAVISTKFMAPSLVRYCTVVSEDVEHRRSAGQVEWPAIGLIFLRPWFIVLRERLRLTCAHLEDTTPLKSYCIARMAYWCLEVDPGSYQTRSIQDHGLLSRMKCYKRRGDIRNHSFTLSEKGHLSFCAQQSL
jgi:hypothetical protein